MIRSALVTGAASGIGAATAAALSSAGWRVIGLDREHGMDESKCERTVQVDLRQRAELCQRLAPTLAEVARLDALVNCAALQHCAALEDTSTEQFEELLSVNLVAPFLLIKLCLPYLQRSKGAIVNVASVHAVATSPSISAYAASKGALVSFTRAASLDLAKYEIRVNAVLPGAVNTPMLRAGLTRSQEGGEAAWAQLAKRHPQGRIGTPEQVAEVILFLCDSSRSAFVNGASIVVDGAVTAQLSTEV